MLPQIKDSVIEYLGSNPGSSTRIISGMLGVSILDAYGMLHELENRGTVQHGFNITGTISFTWTLLD